MDYTKDAVLIDDMIKSHEDGLARNQSSIESDCDYNDTLDYIPLSSRPETYIVPVLFAIIFIIGVMGNGTLIAIFIKHRTMRNVPNMYIVSLAVGDLFVILFCVPFTSTVYTLEGWPYGEFMCKFSEFTKDLSIGVSVFTLTALSADRYFAIVDPMRKLHGRRATRITCITIAGIWLLSIGMALPSALFSYIRAIDQDPSRVFYVCYPFPPELGENYPQVMVMFRFLVYYAIPLGFIGTFYIIMARHLVLSTRNMPGEAQGQAKQIQARKKVAKMILSFVVIFAICFFPSHLFLLFFYYYPNAEDHFNAFWNACRITGFCLSFINSCINPITLYCVSGTFRKQFNEHLFCCLCDADGRSRANRRRAGFGCGCVSLSSAGPGNLFGGDYRLRNGYTAGRGLYRGSTTNSVNGCNSTMKRKSTWDTQSTMSHPLYNLAVTNYAGSNGININTNPNGNSDTPTNPPNPSEMRKHSTTIFANTNTPTNSNPSMQTNLNNSFPLTHHPYQKDYQEYLGRINALEKGDLPPRTRSVSSGGYSGNSSQSSVGVGNYTKTKLVNTKATDGNWTSQDQSSQKCRGKGRAKEVDNDRVLELEPQSTIEEYTVTSFINLGPELPHGRGDACGVGKNDDDTDDDLVDEEETRVALMGKRKGEGTRKRNDNYD